MTIEICIGSMSTRMVFQADGATTDGKGNGMNWDTLWYSDGKITKDGYITITVIPFKSIRFPSQKKQKWGLMLGRFITRNNEFSTWPYVSNRRPNFVQQAGDLEGLEDISPGRNIQLIPYGLFSRSRYLDTSLEAPPQIRTDNESRIGLDGKIVLKNSLTLDIALNPDFSQVESDQPSDNYQQALRGLLPRKTPFLSRKCQLFRYPPTNVLLTADYRSEFRGTPYREDRWTGPSEVYLLMIALLEQV